MSRKPNLGSGQRAPGARSRSQIDGNGGGSRFKEDALDRRPVRPSKLWYNLGLIGAGLLFIAAFAATGMDVRGLGNIPSNIWSYSQLMVSGVFQPLTPEVQQDWINAFEAMFESIAIAWIGTVIGAVFSLPMGFLAARNMTPLPIYIVVRFILSVIRAVPEIVFAIALMMPIFGIGPAGGALTGAMALGVSSIGTLSKLISEAVEAVDEGPLESADASGANKLQNIRWAVLPQVMPEVIAIWLYRFEVNIRASAILGVLGVGGIGTLLRALFNHRMWAEIGITLVVIVVVTILVDQISAWIRHRVIYGAPSKTVTRDQDDDGSGGTGLVDPGQDDSGPDDLGNDPAPKSTRAAASV